MLVELEKVVCWSALRKRFSPATWAFAVCAGVLYGSWRMSHIVNNLLMRESEVIRPTQ